MSDIAIKLENISKLYRLGEIGTGTLSHDLNRWWHRVKGKEDPYAILGEENNRESKGGDWVWAIKDVSFEVKQGEVMGIIGKNGAGKSTLLKILSRVTAPTTGTIKAKGRIASLLEVGTGFHPELTGRENIFLNGAILGMTKAEIRKKFDEIVAFSGVERYIDTPVKRYSSGMYVRLAFAVAAHLESEILIVDEVLAVGDADFQKKCMGKMGEISNKEGRTVLFVSHNISALRSLCNRGMLLNNGKVVLVDDTDVAVSEYLRFDEKHVSMELEHRTDRLGNQLFKFRGVEFYNKDGEQVSETISCDYLRVRIYATCDSSIDCSKIIFGFNLLNQYDEVVLAYNSDEMGAFNFSNDKGYFEIVIPNLYLRANTYSIKLLAFYKSTRAEDTLDIIEKATRITVLNGDLWEVGNINRNGAYSIFPGQFIF